MSTYRTTVTLDLEGFNQAAAQAAVDQLVNAIVADHRHYGSGAALVGFAIGQPVTMGGCQQYTADDLAELVEIGRNA